MYISPAFFSTDLFWSSLKWMMIVLLWGTFAFGIWREDRKIRQQLRDPKKEYDALALLRTLYRRDMQIWLQVSLLLVIVAINDIRHDAAQLSPDFFSPPAPVAETPAPPAPSPVKASPDDKYDKILLKNAAAGLPFSDITAFNEQNGKREAYIDWLKERYESWLITYYYLNKCRAAKNTDYDLILQTLEKDLQGAHADASVEGNILLAATGSYKEMYSEIPCDSPHLASTKSSYDANIQQLRNTLPQNTSNPAPETQGKISGKH